MTLKMDELVEKYIKLREKRAKLKAEYEAENSRYVEIQDRIEAVLLHRFAQMGVDSIKTPAGTAYAQVRSAASIADWDVFKDFIEKQDDPMEFIERRVSKAAIEQFKAEHDDLPPGINWSETRVVNFRR